MFNVSSRKWAIGFGAGWCGAVLLAWSFARFEGLAAEPGIVWAALTFDLVIALPTLFFFLVIRPRNWPPVLVAPAVVLGFMAANWFVPETHASTLELLKSLAAPFELGLILWLILRARKALIGTKDSTKDPIAAFEAAARDLVHSPRAARILATEAAVFSFGLAWRPRALLPVGHVPVLAHVRSGHGGIAFAAIAILLLEGVAVHVLVSRWSSLAAWVLTALTAYSALWIVADFRASKHRPSQIGPDSVIFRAGLRWEVEVPKSLIRSVAPRTEIDPRERLNLTFFGEPSVWFELTESVSARGLYGLDRRVRAIGLDPDEPLPPLG